MRARDELARDGFGQTVGKLVPRRDVCEGGSRDAVERFRKRAALAGNVITATGREQDQQGQNVGQVVNLRPIVNRPAEGKRMEYRWFKPACLVAALLPHPPRAIHGPPPRRSPPRSADYRRQSRTNMRAARFGL